jgi:cell division protein ZapA (FtsZ GTPase activity inhibitor)
MTYLLFFLSAASITALILVIKQLQRYQKENRLLRQRSEETNQQLQNADRKYGGLISREGAIRDLDSQIAALTEQSKRINEQSKAEEYELSTRVTILRTKLCRRIRLL